MSENPLVAVPLYLLLLSLVINSGWAFWRGTDDSGWEADWRDLDELDRAWLAAASRSRVNRATLVERGELELAKGFGRRELRRRARLLMAILSPFIVVAVLMMTNVLGDSWALTVFCTYVLVQSIVVYRRDRQIKNRYRDVQARYLAPPDAEAAPAA